MAIELADADIRSASVARRKDTEREDHAIREKLMRAACEVVGRKGYKAASISRIAEEAGISAGHCYKFFSSRGAILDNVITWIMDEFETHTDEMVALTSSYAEFECLSIDVYFKFYDKYPFFLRILHEAEVETPATWGKFAERRRQRYLAALERAFDDGEIAGYDRDQLPLLGRCFSAMRKEIVFTYATDIEGRGGAIETYNRFVLQGMGCLKKVAHAAGRSVHPAAEQS